MKVIYHIGLHSTDEDRALRCLLKNSEALARIGTVVTTPGRFRPVLRQAMLHLKGAPADRQTQEQILDALIEQDTPKRLLFSSDSFLCVPKRAIEDNVLYPLVGERAPWIRNLFPDAPAEFAFALRNPATFIPALHARFNDDESFGDYLARIRPEEISWVDMVDRLRASVPDCPLTIWCNEDTPLIWPEVLQALSGYPDDMRLDGLEDFLATLMSDEGIERLRAYLDSHTPRNADHYRRIISAFLDKFAEEDAVEMEFDLPDWTSDRIARLTERYETEIAQIAEMHGVRFLHP